MKKCNSRSWCLILAKILDDEPWVRGLVAREWLDMTTGKSATVVMYRRSNKRKGIKNIVLSFCPFCGAKIIPEIMIQRKTTPPPAVPGPKTK